MGLVQPVNRKETSERILDKYESDFVCELDLIHSTSYFPKYEPEEILLRQKKYELWRMRKENRFKVPEGFIKFTPSSASKAKRDLFYKALKVPEDEGINAPFNNRWTRNSSAIHEAVQRDLLYAPYLLDNPAFTIQMVEKEGFGLLPAWEKNIESYKVYEYAGKKFVISGMMDGILTHEETGETFGFEFKTKSNDSWQVHKMKKPAEHHVQQCVAYSLLFETPEGEPINDYLITYEAVAKDKWLSGSSALKDIKVFHVHVTEKQKQSLLKKFAEVVEYVENGELPPIEKSKIAYSSYKSKYLDEL